MPKNQGTAVYKEGDKFKLWLKNVDRPEVALKKIGVMMKAESQASFKAQKHGSIAWDARSGKVNIYGIIADFAAGKSKPPERRFDDRPALVDTGQLKRSIDYQVIGKDTVQVGTKLPYAATHQFGGDIESETITKDVQNRLSDWLLKQQDDTMIRKLGWLLSKRRTGTKLTGTVPARPFLGVTKQTKKDVNEILGINVLVEN